MSTPYDETVGLDARALAYLADAGEDAVSLWSAAAGAASAELPDMGLAAGERPAADVEVLCSAVAAAEFDLARRMHAASVSGSLPLAGAGATLLARGWSAGWARRLARSGEFAAAHPRVAAAWAAGIITSEHVWAVGRHREAMSGDELGAVLEELDPLWGRLSPHAVSAFVERVIRMLHPPSDPEPDEWQAHEARHLSFAVTSDSVLLSGGLPRLEGEAVIAAIESFADRLRCEADHVPAGARRADALVALVNEAHANGGLPTRGGLPVSVSVTFETTAAGDRQWTTSRGHTLTAAEQRFVGCDAVVAPVVVESPTVTCDANSQDPVCDRDAVPREAVAGGDRGLRSGVVARAGTAEGTARRISALAATLLGARIPLAVGRAARTATPAQRRALAVRDRGCVIPGCGIPAESCQTHHVRAWAEDGMTDHDNLVLLCWAHHRQVDLHMWSIEPATPGEGVGHSSTGASPGVAWPANNGAPWVIKRRPRGRWARY